MYKEDLTLNDQQRLICHETKPKQTYVDEIDMRMIEII